MWKDVQGYEGIYQVSDDGKLKNLRYNKILKTYLNNRGYEMVDLSLNGTREKYTVHRIVATAFCDGYFDGAEVDHIDDDKKNNKASNLRWVTRKQNVRKTLYNGTHNVATAQNAAKIKNKKPVAMLSENGVVLMTFESAKEAGEFVGLSSSQIGRVCNGVRKTAAGYRWTFLNKDDDIV